VSLKRFSVAAESIFRDRRNVALDNGENTAPTFGTLLLLELVAVRAPRILIARDPSPPVFLLGIDAVRAERRYELVVRLGEQRIVVSSAQRHGFAPTPTARGAKRASTDALRHTSQTARPKGEKAGKQSPPQKLQPTRTGVGLTTRAARLMFSIVRSGSRGPSLSHVGRQGTAASSGFGRTERSARGGRLSNSPTRAHFAKRAIPGKGNPFEAGPFSGVAYFS